MRNPAFPYRLYLVISTEACRYYSLLTTAEEAIRGGVDIIQLREKKADTATFLSIASQLKKITDRYDIPLIINDNLQVAKAVNAFGIHVGNNDLSPVLVRQAWPSCQCLGYSVEAFNQVANEAARAADYLGISPVFSTLTKQDTIIEWGIDGIQAIRQQTTKPLIAIGNMHQGNVYNVIKAGADSIAVVSAICSSKQPRIAAQQLTSTIISAL